MEFGRTFRRIAELSSSFGRWAHTPGFPGVVTASRIVFLIDWRRMLAVLASRAPHELQWRPSTLVSARGYSAHQVVFGPNPCDLFGLDDEDGDLLSAQDASLSRQIAQQWKLRVMAQGAAL